MSKLGTLYRTFLEKYPIIGNSLVYGTLCVVAEGSQQIINKKVLEKPSKPLDTDTIGKYAIYGTAIAGPLLASWYRFLDKKIPGIAKKTVIKKLLIDQFIFTPNLLVIFYVSMSILERKQDLLEECRNKFAQTFIANVLFWTPAQSINFALIPGVYRVTYVGTCSFLWLNVLCWFKRQTVSESLPQPATETKTP